jgi:hypothetical protein
LKKAFRNLTRRRKGPKRKRRMKRRLKRVLTSFLDPNKSIVRSLRNK